MEDNVYQRNGISLPVIVLAVVVAILPVVVSDYYASKQQLQVAKAENLSLQQEGQ